MPIFNSGTTMPDLAATPKNQEAPQAQNGNTPPSLSIPLQGVPLTSFAENERFFDIDKQESYFRCAQDDHKRYDWDGRLMGYSEFADIAPGFVVPYKHRRPSTRYDLGRVIVTRITSMLFGADRFPEIRVEGDEDAEGFVKALCESSKLPSRMIEARNLGGACGSVGLSFAFVEGRPRVEVHNAKHLTVLRWADESEWKVGAAIKSYGYERRVFDPGTKKIKTVRYYYARYWDENVEIVWSPIPEAVAKQPDWWRSPNKTVQHGYGFTPFYWVQNEPDSTCPDGFSDYEGLCDDLDELNQVFSASSRGTKANCDPTLVIRMDPSVNTGMIKKGSDNALFSPGGAEYLELGGGAVEAAKSTMEQIRAAVLDTASVVLADPEKLSGAAQSAAALRILFAPMTAKCDIHREQYGDNAIKPILVGMLRASKQILAGGSQTRELADGSVVIEQPVIVISKKPIHEGESGGKSDRKVRYEDRVPGDLEEIKLNWNPYFTPTWADIDTATTAVQKANGGKPVISQRTALQSVQSLYGISNVDHELEELAEESKRAMEDAQKLAMGEPAGPDGNFNKVEDEDEDEEEDEEEDDGKKPDQEA